MTVARARRRAGPRRAARRVRPRLPAVQRRAAARRSGLRAVRLLPQRAGHRDGRHRRPRRPRRSSARPATSDLTPGMVGCGHRCHPALPRLPHAQQITHHDPAVAAPQQCTICHTPHGSPNLLLIRTRCRSPNPDNMVTACSDDGAVHRRAGVRRHQRDLRDADADGRLRGADRVHQSRRPRRRQLRQRHRSRHRPLRGLPHHHPSLHQRRDGVTALRSSVLHVPHASARLRAGLTRPALHKKSGWSSRVPAEARSGSPEGAGPLQPRAKPWVRPTTT